MLTKGEIIESLYNRLGHQGGRRRARPGIPYRWRLICDQAMDLWAMQEVDDIRREQQKVLEEVRQFFPIIAQVLTELRER